jgi:hypothetical protein
MFNLEIKSDISKYFLISGEMRRENVLFFRQFIVEKQTEFMKRETWWCPTCKKWVSDFYIWATYGGNVQKLCKDCRTALLKKTSSGKNVVKY